MRTWLIILLLVGLTLAVFGQMAAHDFVLMDDPLYVSGNSHVRTGLTWENVVWAFTRVHDANWIPLTWVSLMIDAEIFGGFAGGYHLSSLVFHVAATLLLFSVLQRSTGAAWKSACVAALFAVHPLHVESVAWLPERKDVLSTFFGMLALLAYVEYVAAGKIQETRDASRVPAPEHPLWTGRAFRWYAASIGAFVCSLLSKQMLVTLPFLLLLLDYWPLGRFRPRAAKAGAAGVAGDECPGSLERPGHWGTSDAGVAATRSLTWLIVEKLPFFLAALIFSVIAFVAQDQGGAVRTLEHFPLTLRIANAVLVCGLYLLRTVWPQGLAVYYPHPGAAISYTHVAVAGALLVALTLAVVLAARRRPFLPVGWFWYLGTLVPVIGLVQVGTQQMADRYTYVPLIGLFIATTWLIPSLLPSGRAQRILLRVLAVGIVLALAVTAWRQTSHWRNSVTLFEHARAVNPENALAHLNLGKAFFDRGDLHAALEHFQTALRLKPDSAVIHGNLGVALHKLGRSDEAAEHFQEAIHRDPDSAAARVNLANLRRDQRRLDAAMGEYRNALHLDPEDLAALQGLASTLSQTGQLDAALETLMQALSVDPNNTRTLISLGIVLNQLGRTDESIDYLRKAVLVAPNSAGAHYNLGAALYSERQYDEARHHFEAALLLDSRHGEARMGLASVLLDLGSLSAGRGQLPAAIKHFNRARELAPYDWRTYYNLGSALKLQGNASEAATHFERAVALNPQSAEARHELGKLLLQEGRRSEAAEHLREAVKLDPENRELKQDLQRALEP